MKLLQLPPAELRQQLAGAGVWLRTGPFSFRLRSRLEGVAKGLGDLYGQFEVRNPHETFADFHVAINPPTRLRRWLRPRASFSFDGVELFQPQPFDQAIPMLERGLDWCVSAHAHQYLLIHAAAVEKNGRTAILPSPSGSGKSTLVAALVLSGWRLLADELTLIDRKTGTIHALPRPICLKNESIPLIRSLSPDAFLNHPLRDAAKDTIAYMRPPKESVRRQHEPAYPSWIIFPTWRAEGETQLEHRSKQQTFPLLSQQALNYSQLGAEGFRVCAELIKHSECYDLQYSQLQQAIAVFEHLATATTGTTDH